MKLTHFHFAFCFTVAKILRVLKRCHYINQLKISFTVAKILRVLKHPAGVE